MRSLFARIGVLFVLVFAPQASAGLIYFENFLEQDGKGAVGPGALLDLAGVDWSVDVSSAGLIADTDWFQVVGERFEGRDVDGEAVWESPLINISGYSDVTLSLLASEAGSLESADYLDVFYAIDGRPGVLIEDWNGGGSPSHTLTDDWGSALISQGGLSGSTLQIRVAVDNNAGTERIRFDDVTVRGVTTAAVPEPATIGWFVVAGVSAFRRRRQRQKP